MEIRKLRAKVLLDGIDARLQRVSREDRWWTTVDTVVHLNGIAWMCRTNADG
jgi:hypothetical protein